MRLNLPSSFDEVIPRPSPVTISHQITPLLPPSLAVFSISGCPVRLDAHHVMYAFNSKRPRDQEQDDFEGNALREKKKHRSLPLRAPPVIFQLPPFAQSNQLASRFASSTLTPVESSDEDRDDNALAETWNRQAQQGPQHVAPTLSADMDVDDGKELQHPAISGDTRSPIPQRLVDQSLTISERAVSHSPYNAIPPAKNSVTRVVFESSASSPHQGAPKDPYSSQDRVWWCGQRLPSPVSDNGDGMPASGKDSVSDVDMSYNISQPASPPDLHQPTFLTDHPMPEYTPVSPSKKKTAFSMGYRADCDKCRRRVPGHYSHIIRC
ncbi:hypothetical protein BO70DRAFT_365847 [Aspergillus heteromorphus CBS 117.55]|uniref:Uncharacterized protein n=1 Tax=Aspergillus heteromorphus CBS 117.55 TaxID=1448321 RepID=A0A317V5J4_9EURO|nr:uncharacterized protein BO70DRAFT_365847 [Aspergillus heteromorphus CBS 117.55]PWY69574.1 hypothetical protein BO70DRAFT_365847 [Aspergillus heteromorphus CBS 117.55]